VLITRSALFAAPFLVWFAWAWWAKRTGKPMGSTPWPWLFATGAFLIGLSLMAGAVFHRDNRNEVYVPAETTPSGEVTKGRFEERAPSKP
jgi:hypothetical protein